MHYPHIHTGLIRVGVVLHKLIKKRCVEQGSHDLFLLDKTEINLGFQLKSIIVSQFSVLDSEDCLCREVSYSKLHHV